MKKQESLFLRWPMSQHWNGQKHQPIKEKEEEHFVLSEHLVSSSQH